MLRHENLEYEALISIILLDPLYSNIDHTACQEKLREYPIASYGKKGHEVHGPCVQYFYREGVKNYAEYNNELSRLNREFPNRVSLLEVAESLKFFEIQLASSTHSFGNFSSSSEEKAENIREIMSILNTTIPDKIYIRPSSKGCGPDYFKTDVIEIELGNVRLDYENPKSVDIHSRSSRPRLSGVDSSYHTSDKYGRFHPSGAFLGMYSRNIGGIEIATELIAMRDHIFRQYVMPLWVESQINSYGLLTENSQKSDDMSDSDDIDKEIAELEIKKRELDMKAKKILKVRELKKTIEELENIVIDNPSLIDSPNLISI